MVEPAAARVGRRRADGRSLARSVCCVTPRSLRGKTAALMVGGANMSELPFGVAG